MNDTRDLYQEMILDHNRSPRNFGYLPGASHRAEGFNPLCGDRISLFLNMETGTIKNLSFRGSGCAISRASASLMTEALKGQDADTVEKYFEGFHAMVTGEPRKEGGLRDLGKLAVFSGVRDYPVRVKCATLPWHTLRAALKQGAEMVSTE